ncbi:MAG: hypothetical protein SF187_07290 [Deltaproteobacteria bacterium]|nr:hypothetical protein [Deltaproteobacteria bacterium]
MTVHGSKDGDEENGEQEGGNKGSGSDEDVNQAATAKHEWQSGGGSDQRAGNG